MKLVKNFGLIEDRRKLFTIHYSLAQAASIFIIHLKKSLNEY